MFVTASLACKELVETSSTVFLVYFLEVILITEIEYQSYFSPIDQNWLVCAEGCLNFLDAYLSNLI